MLVMSLEAVAASVFNSEVAKTMQMLERHNCLHLYLGLDKVIDKVESFVYPERSIERSAVKNELVRSRSWVVVTHYTVLRTCLDAGIDLDNTAVEACLLLPTTITCQSST
jgi:hypothetical protein